MKYISQEMVEKHLKPEIAIDLVAQALQNSDAFQVGEKHFFSTGSYGGLGTLFGAENNGKYAICKVVGLFENHGKTTSHPGAILLFDKQSGTIVAHIEAGSLTAIRTAACAAFATYQCANQYGEHVIFGTGVQAEACINSFVMTLPPEKYTLIGRSEEKTKSLIQKLKNNHPQLQIDFVSIQDAHHIVKKSNTITMATGSHEPLLDTTFELSESVHINCLGSSQPHQCEFDPELLPKFKVVCDHPTITAKESGVLAAAQTKNIAISFDEITSIKRNERSLYLSTGNGSQDLVCARWLYKQNF